MGRFKQDVADESATESDESKTDTDIDTDNHDDTRNNDHDDDDSPPLFSEGEKVLAFHKDRFYESKVRKVKLLAKEWKYFVHYLNWSKKWDEWVDFDRLMKFTEENVQRLKADDQKQGLDKNTRAGGASQSKPRNSTVARGKKRKNDSVVKEETTRLEKLVNIQIPHTLKKQLVDDCEFIVHLGKLVKLPRSPNIDGIFHKYLDYKLKNDRIILDSVGEILKGLRCYFDKALPVMLLYKSERQQYQEAVVNEISPSKVYGAEHLLRLFVKLPELLFHANIEEETLREMQQKLLDFLKFLQKNQATFFLSSYDIADTVTKDQDD